MKRIVLDKIASVTLNCGLSREVHLSDKILVEEGSVLAVRVLNSKGTYNLLELVSGRMSRVKPGDMAAVVLGHRKALFGYSGYVPEHIEVGSRLNLLNQGGVLGLCDGINPDLGEPFVCEVLGQVLEFPYVGERIGVPAHISSGAIPMYNDGTICGAPVVAVAGTSMSAIESLRTSFPDLLPIMLKLLEWLKNRPGRRSGLCAYSPLSHRHEPEIAGLLSADGGSPLPCVEFVPHSGPYVRGIHATLRMELKEPMSDEDLLGILEDTYLESPFVRSSLSMPSISDVVGSNRCHIGLRARGTTLIVTTVIDNLIKGAAGGAVEHVREAIPVLCEYADAIGVRCFAEGVDLERDLSDQVIKKMAELSSIPFINLESSVNHPCQALADWKTLNDYEIPASGGRFVLSWAFHPKALPYAVPAAALWMAAHRGMDVSVLRPEGYELPAPIMARARMLAEESGGSVRSTVAREEAMDGAHVLYVKSWGAAQYYGDPAVEMKQRVDLRSWCVDESWFKNATSDSKFMHCLPVRRNVKVADEILDGPRSVVVKQSGNRLHTQKALMVEMFGKS